jgi:hypothetical protein
MRGFPKGSRGNLKRLLCRFAPRNDNEENRELEEISNVREVYIIFPSPRK